MSARRVALVLGIAAGLLTPATALAQGQSFDSPQPQNQPLQSAVQPWGESFGDLPVVAKPYIKPRQQESVPGAAGQQQPSGMQYGARPKIQYDEKGQPIFNNSDYLNGVGSGRPPVGLYNPQQYAQPEKTIWTPKPLQTDYRSPYNKGFFEGKVNPNDTFDDLKSSLRVGPLRTHEDPAWAKQKLKMRHFQDGQEHFGNDDPYGFFNQ